MPTRVSAGKCSPASTRAQAVPTVRAPRPKSSARRAEESKSITSRWRDASCVYTAEVVVCPDGRLMSLIPFGRVRSVRRCKPLVVSIAAVAAARSTADPLTLFSIQSDAPSPLGVNNTVAPSAITDALRRVLLQRSAFACDPEHRGVTPRPIRYTLIPSVDLEHGRAGQRDPHLRIASSLYRCLTDAGPPGCEGCVFTPAAAVWESRATRDPCEQQQPRGGVTCMFPDAQDVILFRRACRGYPRMPSGGQKRPGKRWLSIRRSLTSPEMRPFRQDPRFPNPVTRLGLMEYWKQYGPLDDCELQGGKRFGVVDPQRRHHIAPKQPFGRYSTLAPPTAGSAGVCVPQSEV